MLASNWFDTLLWIFALGGTFFLILRIILMMIGGDFLPGNIDFQDLDLGSSYLSFEILSINSITAFIMMFGWVGLTCYKGFNLGKGITALGAVLGGFAAMFIISYIFSLAKKLVGYGSQFTINDTIGSMATVYQTIPAKGSGKIQISLPGDLIREINAISKTKEEIKSFTMVKVVEIINSETVSVEVN